MCCTVLKQKVGSPHILRSHLTCGVCMGGEHLETSYTAGVSRPLFLAAPGWEWAGVPISWSSGLERILP